MEREKINEKVLESPTEQRQSLELEDRISSLPDALICHILSFIDTKLAVQSTILSKRWLHLWKYLPALNIFTNSFYDESSFNHFISKFLESHDTETIHTLIVKDKDYKSSENSSGLSSSVMMDLIYHAVSRHVKHVDLTFNGEGLFAYPKSKNPNDQCLFTSQLVTTLVLNCFIMGEELSFDLPSLKTLSLRFVVFNSSIELSNILSRCMGLEFLEIKDCDVRWVNALRIPGAFRNTAVCSSLKILRLESMRMVNEEGKKFPIDMFSGLLSLEDLEIRYCIIYDAFTISCPRLVNLKIEDIIFVSEKAKIIVSVPELAYFKFDTYGVIGRVKLVVDRSTRLENVDINIRKPYPFKGPCKKWIEESFPIIDNLFQGLNSAKSLCLTSETIEALALFADMLENQVSPFNNLEILKVRVQGSSYESLNIPPEVVQYLSSGSPKLKGTDILSV